MEHLDLELDPKQPGELTLARLRLVGGQTWVRMAAQTTYANRNLILQNVALTNDEQIRLLSVDASKIASRKLAIRFEYSARSGHLSGNLDLQEAHSSLDTRVEMDGANIPLGIINKYAALPENFIQGDVQTLKVTLAGLLSSPRTWTGTGKSTSRE